MTSTTPARAERAALCDLFLEVGPDEPTLCGELDDPRPRRPPRRPRAAPGRRPSASSAAFLAGHSEKVRLAETERPWTEIVERVRSGPPVWNPMHLEPIDTARQHASSSSSTTRTSGGPRPAGRRGR